MIIPDYNDGTVNVHVKLEEEDFTLIKEDIAAKAFSYMTGLEPTNRITKTSFENVEYPIFSTEHLYLYIACGESDITDDTTLNASILMKDKKTKTAIVQFHSVVYGRFFDESSFESVIDFLFKYKDELFTSKSGVFI